MTGIGASGRSIKPGTTAPYAANSKGGTDARLYQTIVTEMDRGASYYPAAAEALRAGGFPLRPFIAFRLPTLATLLTLLPAPMPRGMIFLLIAAVVALWTARLSEAFGSRTRLAIGAALILCGSVVAAQPGMILFHETWAALLIALSLALRRRDRWIGSVVAGLCAVLIRETAIAYVLAMGILALIDGKKREGAAWGAVIAVFAGYLLWHVGQVAAVTSAADPVSSGWNGMGGWTFFIAAMRLTTPLTLFPQWLSAILIPLALLGWISWRTPFALRTSLTLIGYAVMLMVFARPDNFYWGLLIAPLLLLGLMFVPAALTDLIVPFRRPALDSDAAARH
ncbi:hypothetical protein [Sphingobium boeckii]|uniref:MFS family permease n=1 Tax=Sphingobium boeckii TaxID=1082345 RepID=A0A7W9AGK6_9SPHN|nr:hypothetical protein [Sphingobium boeckii]MBB5685183.1 MFS family permease [Sphingobium boeckii]